jgi:hypothetical protein
MKWLKRYELFRESKTYTNKNLISEICIGMVLLNNEFLDNILDRGLKARYSESSEIFLTDLKNQLPHYIYSKIKYAVIQSGTALKGNENIGVYNNERLNQMIKVVKKHGLTSKEHNGDYIPDHVLRDKFKNGLEAINIAPEFGQLETNIILEKIKNNTELFNAFYKMCLDLKRWVKWVQEDFDPEKNQLELINICGHYSFSTKEFLCIKQNLPTDTDLIIIKKIQDKISNFIKLI